MYGLIRVHLTTLREPLLTSFGCYRSTYGRQRASCKPWPFIVDPSSSATYSKRIVMLDGYNMTELMPQA